MAAMRPRGLAAKARKRPARRPATKKRWNSIWAAKSGPAQDQTRAGGAERIPTRRQRQPRTGQGDRQAHRRRIVRDARRRRVQPRPEPLRIPGQSLNEATGHRYAARERRPVGGHTAKTGEEGGGEQAGAGGDGSHSESAGRAEPGVRRRQAGRRPDALAVRRAASAPGAGAQPGNPPPAPASKAAVRGRRRREVAAGSPGAELPGAEHRRQRRRRQPHRPLARSRKGPNRRGLKLQAGYAPYHSAKGGPRRRSQRRAPGRRRQSPDRRGRRRRSIRQRQPSPSSPPPAAPSPAGGGSQLAQNYSAALGLAGTAAVVSAAPPVTLLSGGALALLALSVPLVLLHLRRRPPTDGRGRQPARVAAAAGRPRRAAAAASRRRRCRCSCLLQLLALALLVFALAKPAGRRRVGPLGARLRGRRVALDGGRGSGRRHPDRSGAGAARRTPGGAARRPAGGAGRRRDRTRGVVFEGDAGDASAALAGPAVPGPGRVTSTRGCGWRPACAARPPTRCCWCGRPRTRRRRSAAATVPSPRRWSAEPVAADLGVSRQLRLPSRPNPNAAKGWRGCGTPGPPRRRRGCGSKPAMARAIERSLRGRAGGDGRRSTSRWRRGRAATATPRRRRRAGRRRPRRVAVPARAGVRVTLVGDRAARAAAGPGAGRGPGGQAAPPHPADLQAERPADQRPAGPRRLRCRSGGLPRAPALLLVHPPRLPGGAVGSKPLADSRLSGEAEGDPLLAGVDLSALTIDSEAAERLVLPRWARAVAWSPEGPLLAAGSDAGQRVAILAFEPGESNLPGLLGLSRRWSRTSPPGRPNGRRRRRSPAKRSTVDAPAAEAVSAQRPRWRAQAGGRPTAPPTATLARPASTR